MHDSTERYVVDKKLGRGAQAETFVATDRDTGRAVVLKRIGLARAASWKAIELFEREAGILKTLSHPGVPAFLDFFRTEADGRHTLHLVQELVLGSNLEEIVSAAELLQEAEVVQVATRVLEVLVYLHGRSPPLVHRDLKPANLIRKCDSSIAVVDFGAAQAVLPIASSGGSTVVGTYGYMAPEQFIGRACPASDLYALGGTLVFMLSGLHPADLETKRLRCQYRDAVRISEPFAQFIDTLLEPAAEDRFRDAEAARGALLHIAQKSSKSLAKRQKSEAERVEKLMHNEDSWIEVRAMDEAVALEVPPLHNRRERLRSAVSAGSLLSSFALFPFAPALALLIGIPALTQLILSLRSSRLLVGKKEFTLRSEIFGVPYRRYRGDTYHSWIKEEQSPLGPTGDLSMWEGGIQEHALGAKLDEEERRWLLEVLPAELRRIKSKARLLEPPGYRRPRRPKVHLRINLCTFPSNACRRL